MNRHAYASLEQWKNSVNRKPLIVLGARQVGKTFLVKDFGAKSFAKTHVVNFELNPEFAKIFEQNLDPIRLLKEFSFALGDTIDPARDLLFFDEIQAAPAALTSLKHFHEKMPSLAVCSAGSLLGLHLNSASFPVGNVEFLKIYPLSFAEFLEARAAKHVVLAHRAALEGENLPVVAHDLLWDLFREYLTVGGLPEIVANYLKSPHPSLDAFNAARANQLTLINAYLSDVAKHSGKVNAMHIERVWRAVSSQIAGVHDLSTKRFTFKDVVPGIHAYGRLAGAIDWLIKAGLVIHVPICDHAETPLQAFTKENQFKLFMFDVGVLGAFLSLPPAAIQAYDFGTYKGYIAENFVAQELRQSRPDGSLFSWAEAKSEIEFLLQGSRGGVPVEVKSGRRVRAQSLRVYNEKYKPAASLVLSGRPMSVTQTSGGATLVNLPLYLTPRAWSYT